MLAFRVGYSFRAATSALTMNGRYVSLIPFPSAASFSRSRRWTSCVMSASSTYVAGAASPASPRRMIVVPTFTVSPSFARSLRTFPVTGDGIWTVTLSVITSTIRSFSRIGAPSLTSHFTISPSWTPSPMSGSLNSRANRLPGAWKAAPDKKGVPRDGLRRERRPCTRRRRIVRLRRVQDRDGSVNGDDRPDDERGHRDDVPDGREKDGAHEAPRDDEEDPGRDRRSRKDEVSVHEERHTVQDEHHA